MDTRKNTQNTKTEKEREKEKEDTSKDVSELNLANVALVKQLKEAEEELKNTEQLDAARVRLPAIEINTLLDLPEEVVLQILTELDIISLFRVALVSRELNRISTDDNLWRFMFYKYFPSSIAEAEKKREEAKKAGKDIAWVHLLIEELPSAAPLELKNSGLTFTFGPEDREEEEWQKHIYTLVKQGKLNELKDELSPYHYSSHNLSQFLNIKDERNYTIFDWAHHYGHKDMLNLFYQIGTKESRKSKNTFGKNKSFEDNYKFIQDKINEFIFALQCRQSDKARAILEFFIRNKNNDFFYTIHRQEEQIDLSTQDAFLLGHHDETRFNYYSAFPSSLIFFNQSSRFRQAVFRNEQYLLLCQARFFPVPVEAGQGLLFDSRCFHTAMPMHSHTRISIDFRLVLKSDFMQSGIVYENKGIRKQMLQLPGDYYYPLSSEAL